MARESNEKNPTENRPKLDVTGEFFSVGAPLHAVRAGYIKRRADDLLHEVVVSGRYAHVLAPDRSGKSSLIAATAARLEGHGFKVAILDLQQIGERDGGTDSGRWYYSVAYRLLRQLRIRYDLQTWWQDKSVLSNRQRLVEFYSEVVLQFVPERIVVFIDEIQCIEDLPYADQLLASIRAAHNARATDPDFSRISFVLLGECDPVSLIEGPELSPFNVTQAIVLDDFSRAELNMFATEINLPGPDASRALDRIYYWTNGQPYLSQKLARAISRETLSRDINDHVDHIATRQLAGRAALHSEPHMSHIHRRLVNDRKRSEPLLNLYGKLRKGIKVAADLGSMEQRRLIAVGLVVIDEQSNLAIRNRLYAAVFTTRWANENLPTRIRVPAMVTGAMLLLAMIPFWYTQWLPNPYVRTLASDSVELSVAQTAYENLKSFPGHADTAENVYRNYLERRALQAVNIEEVRQLASQVSDLASAGRLAEEFEANFWDRKASAATRGEDRDTALLASLQSLVLSTSARRKRAAALVGDDYPLLLTTMPELPMGKTIFDPVGGTLTTAVGAAISQWSYTPQGVQERVPWSMTALEVSPLVRRVVIDREGAASRVGLTLNISHSRLSDLRIKIIAPSGRAVEVDPGVERASSGDDIRIPTSQLRELVGEALNGTWSISIRDESLGIAGQFVGWNLKLNSQGAVEYFQRGLNIPEPVERATDDVWFDASGRYAVARTTQSDSARIWDLVFAEPVRAIAVTENEALIGLSASARQLVTATQNSVNIWDTASGDKVATLAVGAASANAILTPDGTHLFVEHRGDVETRLELWSIENGGIVAEVVVAGAPAHVAIDRTGSRVAVADFDRAVRVWDFESNELLGQFDLAAQPSEILLSADGRALGAVYADSGISLWNMNSPQQPLLEEFGNGNWHLVFSPSGSVAAAGRPETGFQLYSSEDGRLIGPALGVRRGDQTRDLLAFSQDEQILLTGSSASLARLWRTTPPGSVAVAGTTSTHSIWNPSADRVALAAPDGSFIVIGDPNGHVHFVSTDAELEDVVAIGNDVSFLGHNSEVRLLGIDQSGSLAASAGVDNNVRLWKSENGEPLPYVISVPGSSISQLVFSPDASSLAVLSGDHLSIISVADGRFVAQFELGGSHEGIAYAGNESLYIGGENGTLQLVSLAGEDNWLIQQVWQGTEPIRLLQASPRNDFLILVDGNNVAAQFELAKGRLAPGILQLATKVQEVVFDESGTRAYFRTSRWVHRASSSITGLTWKDALFAPRPLHGAGIIFGNGIATPASAHRAYLPTAKNGYIGLVELDFAAPASVGLFGSRDELLLEWQGRISASPRAEF